MITINLTPLKKGVYWIRLAADHAISCKRSANS